MSLSWHQLSSVGLSELWIGFRVDRNIKWIAIHSLAIVLTPERCDALPSWYCFSGCDTVSSFNGKGKRSAWDTCQVYQDVTEVFKNMSSGSIERFVCLVRQDKNYFRC